MASKKSLRNYRRLRIWTGCKLDFWYAKMASKSRHLSVGRLVCGDGFEPQRFVTWTCMHRWLWIWEICQLDLYVKMASNDPGFLVDSTAVACSAMASRGYVKIVAGSSRGLTAGQHACIELCRGDQWKVSWEVGTSCWQGGYPVGYESHSLVHILKLW